MSTSIRPRRLSCTGRTMYRRVIDLVGADHILFGSDFPLLAQGRVLKEIRSQGLPADQERLILGGNAARLLGLTSEVSSWRRSAASLPSSCPAEVKQKMGELEASIRKQREFNVKWVDPESIHLTLKFLGNVSSGMVTQLTDAMTAAAVGTAPFRLEVAGTGVFPTHSGCGWSG